MHVVAEDYFSFAIGHFFLLDELYDLRLALSFELELGLNDGSLECDLLSVVGLLALLVEESRVSVEHIFGERGVDGRMDLVEGVERRILQLVLHAANGGDVRYFGGL